MTRLLAHTLPEGRNPANGRLDALKLAGVLGLDAREMARLLNRDPSGLRRNADSKFLQDDLRVLEDISVRLRDLVGDWGYVRMWLRAPNPELGGEAPLAYLERHQPRVVQDFIAAIEQGQPT